jgi:hypothetical protein
MAFTKSDIREKQCCFRELKCQYDQIDCLCVIVDINSENVAVFMRYSVLLLSAQNIRIFSNDVFVYFNSGRNVLLMTETGWST